ncbi:MAG: hypothetical protein JXQ72_06505 [Anaerolineae bacterium]|nr:hypothetical protein [Anaerolineae bacterium]
MFQQSHRGTLVWLLIVGLALVLSLGTGNISTAVGGVLLAVYLLLVLMVTRSGQLGALLEGLSLPGTREPESTEVAQEAMARARRYPDHDTLVRLLDVGLIVDEQRPDGTSLRRGRFISLDDDSIRPFATVHVPEGLSERLSLVRFEIRDDNGELQYAYEAEKWLMMGENALLPDYRFPVRKKADAIQPGNWTAHVIVNGGILGVHKFNLSSSLAARRRLMSSDGELRERVWRTPEANESLPLSLEELLRQQSRERSQSGQN